ncbi:hypothetical protein BY996DRAFT_6506659 [Phakopsora pachyrhizi]|nr:hypothetical protein BY996DRAFT_6506659 [Phakopsora pachyrhizi]
MFFLHFKKVNGSIPAPPIDGWWLRKSSSRNKNLWLQSLENDLKLFQKLMPSSSGGPDSEQFKLGGELYRDSLKVKESASMGLFVARLLADKHLMIALALERLPGDPTSLIASIENIEKATKQMRGCLVDLKNSKSLDKGELASVLVERLFSMMMSSISNNSVVLGIDQTSLKSGFDGINASDPRDLVSGSLTTNPDKKCNRQQSKNSESFIVIGWCV